MRIPTGAVGPIGGEEARPHLRSNDRVAARSRARRTLNQAWKAERETPSASQGHATGQSPMLCDERELHIASMAK